MKQPLVALAVMLAIAAGQVYSQTVAPTPDASSTAAPAHPHCSDGMHSDAPPHPGMWGGMMKRFCEELQLTDVQQDRLKAIVAAAKDWQKQHAPDHRDHMAALMEEFKKDKMDNAKLDEIQRSAEQARTDAHLFIRQTLIQVHDVLTPEQREKAAGKIGMFIAKFLPGQMPPHPEMHMPPPPPDAR